MTQPPFLFLRSAAALLLTAAMATFPARAERADRGKPLVVESDALNYDELKRVTVLTGNVVITKGTLVIKASRVEVREGADGFRNAVALSGGGRQATFRQKRDAANEYIDGQADRLEYEERREAIRFVNNATVRLLRGTSVGDEITGNLITYDGTSEVFNVSGGAPKTGTAAAPSGGRVRAVLTPREGSEAAASQDDGAPAAPASAPGRSRPAPGAPR